MLDPADLNTEDVEPSPLDAVPRRSVSKGPLQALVSPPVRTGAARQCSKLRWQNSMRSGRRVFDRRQTCWTPRHSLTVPALAVEGATIAGIQSVARVAPNRPKRIFDMDRLLLFLRWCGRPHAADSLRGLILRNVRFAVVIPLRVMPRVAFAMFDGTHRPMRIGILPLHLS